jgi:ATP-binding protein involved in chromosome partitioning
MIEERVLEELQTVIEPKYDRGIVKLGMVRDLTLSDGEVVFTLALTLYDDPHADTLEGLAKDAALRVEGINEVTVTRVVDVPTSPAILQRPDLPAKHLIAVSSGKGGVGKSTVAANISVALGQQGARVGLMDADILGPNIPTLMGVEEAPPPSANKMNPAEAHGIKLMSMGFLVEKDKPLIWRGPMIQHAIRQLFTDVTWGQLDYMVIDLPPGTGDAQLGLAQLVPLTGAIIVTQPQEVALSDARRGLAMFETVEVDVLGVIENMAGEFFGSGGGEAFAEERDVAFLGRVPLDPQVRVGGDEGVPVVVSHPATPSAQALHHVAQQVALQASRLALAEDDDTISITTIE